LANLSHELERTKDELEVSEGPTERLIAKYLTSAIQDI